MSDSHALHILLVEDNSDHAEMILRHVHRSGRGLLKAEHVASLSDGVKAICDREWDAVLLDLQLPDSRGLETLSKMVEVAAGLPVIVLTSLGDEELATKALQQGAQDYLVKDDFTSELLNRTVRYAIERKRIEERLKMSLASLAGHASELEQLNRKLQEQNRDLGHFNHMISHDLREPIRHLMVFSQRLQTTATGALPEKAWRDVENIHSAASRMESSIAGLQVLSQASRRDINRTTVALHTCVHAALADLEQIVTGRGATVTCGPLLRVVADPALLTLLFRNLISNAIKYCVTAPNIQVTIEEDGPRAVFGVRDNGIGVDPRYAEQIFDPFQRLHSREEYGGGSGLGLAICRKIVERHGGNIWVEPNDGGGSHFRFTLGAGAVPDLQEIETTSSTTLV